MSNQPPTGNSDWQRSLTTPPPPGGGEPPIDPSLSLDVHFLAQACSLVQSALSAEAPIDPASIDTTSQSSSSQTSMGTTGESTPLEQELESESVDSLLQFAMSSSGPYLPIDSEPSSSTCSSAQLITSELSELVAASVSSLPVVSTMSTLASSNLQPSLLPSATMAVDSPLPPPTSGPPEQPPTRLSPTQPTTSQQTSALVSEDLGDASLTMLLRQHPQLQEGFRTMLHNNDLLLQSMAVSAAVKSSASASSNPSVNSLLSSINEAVEGSIMQTAAAPSMDTSSSSRLPVLAQVIHRGGPGVSPGVTPKSTAISHPPIPSPVPLQSSIKLGATQPSPAIPHTHSSPPHTKLVASSKARSPLTLPCVFPRDSVSIDPPINPPSPLSISTSLLPSIPPLSPSPDAPTHTVIQPVDQEPMDVDVGQAPIPLDRPPHLVDHDYCIYNPTLSIGAQDGVNCLHSIPSERLSYAPELPDSPRTLYKLLKILPRRSSATPRARSQPRTLSTPTFRSKHR